MAEMVLSLSFPTLPDRPIGAYVLDMVNVALIVKLVAKEGRSGELAEFLRGALPLAEAEDFTPAWFAIRADDSTFYIVDAFANDGDRNKHIDGPIAAALMAKAPELLAQPPRIDPVDVLAAKLPR